MTRLIAALLMCAGAGCASNRTSEVGSIDGGSVVQPRLGNFSVSLAVEDLGASRAFYEKLGFRVIDGDQSRNWLILQGDTATIGLFQGMFEGNIMTFNPGWDRSGRPLADFDDVREIQRTLIGRGVALESTADESSTGPASLTLLDPDGNRILIDQHVPAPGG